MTMNRKAQRRGRYADIRRFAFTIGQGVILASSPERGVGLVLAADSVRNHATYWVEWPRDQATGLQARTICAPEELVAAP